MKRTSKRPISPHISIYRWQWSMVYSILHRATGIVLSIGLIFIIALLTSIAFAPTSFALLAKILSSPLAMIILIAWTWALFYHLCNGIRFLLFAKNIGISLQVASKTGNIAFLFSLIFTAAFWYCIFAF